MEKSVFEYSFIALSASLSFAVKTPADNEELPFYIGISFADVLDMTDQRAEIKNPLRNTLQQREKVGLLVDRYKGRLPQINKLNSYFRKLRDNEYFLFLPVIEIPIRNRLIYSNYLSAVNSGRDFETVQSEFNNLFGELFVKYALIAFDETTKVKIGQSDKSKRVCRFCGRTSPQVTFKKVAHAISEALGNKHIINNEECDTCNSKYGNGIEQDLVAYLDIYRSFFDIKGKSGSPKVKGKNFEFFGLDREFTLSVSGTDGDIKKQRNFKLDTNKKISHQNLYKALCKFAISVVDARHLPNFQTTIAWIKGEHNVALLPQVAILSSYHFFNSKHPKIGVYIRTADNNELPFAVGELHFTFLTFVFIIPTFKSIERSFIENEEFNTFWNFFKHFSLQKDWKFANFCDICSKNT